MILIVQESDTSGSIVVQESDTSGSIVDDSGQYTAAQLTYRIRVRVLLLVLAR